MKLLSTIIDGPRTIELYVDGSKRYWLRVVVGKLELWHKAKFVTEGAKQ